MERQGHWISGLTIYSLKKKVRELNEHLYDVKLERKSVHYPFKKCPTCEHKTFLTKDLLTGYVHYIV